MSENDSLDQYKIADGDVARKGVIAAPDRLTGTAAENKALFDRLVREVVAEKLNGLIDALDAGFADKQDALPAARGEGENALVLGDTDGNTATGDYAVAEGYNTSAAHAGAHVGGFGTFSEFPGEHVFGGYNARIYSGHIAPGRPGYLEVVGNGSDADHRSNARTLDRNGNQWLAGKLTLGENAVPTMDTDAATKRYVDAGLADVAQIWTAASDDEVDGMLNEVFDA